MKYIFSILLTTVFVSQSQAQYFEANLRKNGTNLEFVIRPKPGGPNITNFRFDNIDMFIRWPNSEPTPNLGTPVPNTVDFPGLTIDNLGMDTYQPAESGFTNMEFSSNANNSTTTAKNYVAGTEYVVFTVPVVGSISPLVALAANNEDQNTINYFLTLTRNTNLPGIGGISDHTSHGNGGSLSNQLFYASPATLLSQSTLGRGITTSFFQAVSSVLPVKFSSFDVAKKEDNANLTWTVESENAQNAIYEVERSLDGFNFDKIQSIAANNNGNYNYITVDANLSKIPNALAVGIVYYRIKQIDVNGKFVYTDVKTVRLIDKGTLITVFPNPVNDYTTVRVDATKAENATLTLLNVDGKQLQTISTKLNKGINDTKVSMNNLPAGNYMIKVTTSTEVKTIKLVKL
jgi:hypothetical protein